MHQSDTRIDNIISSAINQYGSNESAILAKIALDLIGSVSPLKLLSNVREIIEILTNITNQTHARSSIFASYSISKVNQLLSPHLDAVGKILGCDRDEHAYFLASLSVLAKSVKSLNVDQVIAEILSNNLHKIASVATPSVFVGREKEVEHILRVLRRKERNHVLIVGDTGVGKTTLAQTAATASSLPVFQPTNLNTDILYQLVTLTSKKSSTCTFIDEIIGFDLKQVFSLLPYTAVIATANELAYRRLSQDNQELISKFEIISLATPDKNSTLAMLSAHSSDLGINLDPKIAEVIYEMSSKYLDRPQFPSRALGVLHEAIVMVRSSHASEITTDYIHTIISQKTNIPISSLSEDDKKDLSSLPAKLANRVKGQAHAITAVSRTISRSRLGIGSRNRPLGSFLFVGPSGVGKTELAKALAESLFGDKEAMIRIDMSEYAQEHTVQRLIGAPPGYIGFEEGGQLTNPVKKKPYSLILLDEIEKAHPRIYDIFLQVLDDGRLTDGRGQSIDFKNTVIIATSNAGIEDILDLVSAGKNQDEIAGETKLILEDYFRLEFLNRFDGIITFGALSLESLKEIAQVHLNILSAELKLRGITLEYDPSLIARLAKESEDPRYGARGLIRLIQDKVENVIAEKIISGQLKEGDHISF